MVALREVQPSQQAHEESLAPPTHLDLTDRSGSFILLVILGEEKVAFHPTLYTQRLAVHGTPRGLPLKTILLL